MSRIKPRMAVAYHFFKDFDTTPDINDRVRKTYDEINKEYGLNEKQD